MMLTGEKVILRDMTQTDIEDRIRWETVETEWLDWDAPWEDEPFCAESYRETMQKRLSVPKDPNRCRFGFQICLNDAIQRHIGWINAYFVDENFVYTQDEGRLTIGIGIPEQNARRQGFATEAWALYITYALSHGFSDIYTQTWSGNYRVLGLMRKLGFEECHRVRNAHVVRGEKVDGLTFRLNKDAFKAL